MFGGGSVPERLVKRWISRRVHWWFAYNNLSRRVVRDELGYPADRITTVMNSIDTRALSAARGSISAGQMRDLRALLGLKGNSVCLHVSGMTPSKRLPFLLECCDDIRRRIPDFELLVIGPDAFDAGLVKMAAATRPWIHWLGPKRSVDAAPFWAISQLLLYPGMVGLVAVDSFAMGVPLVTMDVPDHSVEIDYVESGRNGMVVHPWRSHEAYVQEVCRLLADREALQQLQEGALADATTYSTETMVGNFSRGILEALAAPPLPRVRKRGRSVDAAPQRPPDSPRDPAITAR